jgi:hypothetical protein
MRRGRRVPDRPASLSTSATRQAFCNGPKTAEGLARIRAARTTHGMRTAEMEQMRRLVRELRAGAKRLVEMT